MCNVLKSDNVFLKLQLKTGYLLKVISKNEFRISHESGNGYIDFKSRLALLEYMVQINEDFVLVNKDGAIIE